MPAILIAMESLHHRSNDSASLPGRSDVMGPQPGTMNRTSASAPSNAKRGRRRPQSAAARLSVDRDGASRGRTATRQPAAPPGAGPGMGGGIAYGEGGYEQRPQTAGSMGGRQASAPRRAASASRSRQERGNVVDDLLQQIHSLKNDNNGLQERNAQFSAANARLKRELSKLTNHVNQLLEHRSETNRSLVTDIRRETEKSLMVKRLKEQIVSLQEDLAERERTITQLRRQQARPSPPPLSLLFSSFPFFSPSLIFSPAWS